MLMKERWTRALREIENSPSQAAEKARLQAKKLDAVKARLEPLKEGFAACRQSLKLNDEAAIACFQSLHAVANVAVIQRRLVESDAETKTLDDQIKQCELYREMD
jgi:hypothetical protein